MEKIFLLRVFVFTIVVVLREDQTDKSPTVVASRRGGRGRAASHLAELLSQSQELLAQN